MGTLALTRVTAGATISPSTENANQAAIEAVVNGGIEADNIAADAVGKAELASDVVRSGYGLVQHTDGALYVDVSDTNPGLEISDGGVRVKVDDSSIERASGGLQVKAAGVTAAMLASTALAAAWPVGSVFLSVLSTNPATLLGFGTWSQIAQGKMLIGQSGSDTDFDTAEETGGAKTKTLTTTELPAHTHTLTAYASDGEPGNGVDVAYATAQADITTSSAGSGSAFSIMNPYFVVYCWKRVS